MKKVCPRMLRRKKSSSDPACMHGPYDVFSSGKVVLFIWENKEGWPPVYVSENVSKIFGYDSEEFKEEKISYLELIHPDDLMRVSEEVADNSFPDVESFEHQHYRVRKKDGSYMWIYDSSTIIRNGRGDITHYIGYIIDVTEDKLREEQLKEQNELLAQSAKLSTLGEIASTIAHEILNPLAVIDSLSTKIEIGLKNEDLDRESISELMTKIKTFNNRAITITKNINRASRKTVGDDFVEKNIKDIIFDAISFSKFSIYNNKNIKLVTPTNLDDCFIDCRPVEISQIFINLLNNAFDSISATNQAGEVAISYEKIGEHLYIRVFDSGPGVPADLQEKIFNSFFTTKEEGKGTGLGLSISAKIAKEHKGSLSYEADKSSFLICLPLKKGRFNEEQELRAS